jgi:hypothetical protein
MIKANWKNSSEGLFGGICTRRPNADDLFAARSSGRLRYRLDPHHPALGSGNAGASSGAAYMTITNNGNSSRAWMR